MCTRWERGQCEPDLVGRQTLSESPRMIRTGCSMGQAEQPVSGSEFPNSTLTTKSLSVFTTSSVADKSNFSVSSSSQKC